MNHHLTDQLDGGVPADVETASAFEAMLAVVLLALALQVFWRCCCSCYRNYVEEYFTFFSSSSFAGNMELWKIAAVEKILKYTFKNKSLLVEALTHSSCCENVSYERLEFLGDAALHLAVATHFFCLEQKLNSGHLTKLREDIVSNEKLARVAAKLGLYQFVRKRNTAPLDLDVEKYEKAVKQGDDQNITDRNPDILADIVESLAGAVYLDVNYDLTKLWEIFEDILPLDEITLPKDEAEIDGAQNKLHGLCGKNKWKDLHYRVVKAEGNGHECKYVFSVETKIGDRVWREKGDEKSSTQAARNSAAYLLICSLEESGIIK